MSEETTNQGKREAWRRLTDSAAAESELGHLEGIRILLESTTARAQELADRQAQITAEKLECSALLRTLMRDGERCATIVRKAILFHYGDDAEKLAEIGMRPYRRKTAKRDAAAEPATPRPSR